MTIPQIAKKIDSVAITDKMGYSLPDNRFCTAGGADRYGVVVDHPWPSSAGQTKQKPTAQCRILKWYRKTGQVVKL